MSPRDSVPQLIDDRQTRLITALSIGIVESQFLHDPKIGEGACLAEPVGAQRLLLRETVPKRIPGFRKFIHQLVHNADAIEVEGNAVLIPVFFKDLPARVEVLHGPEKVVGELVHDAELGESQGFFILPVRKHRRAMKRLLNGTRSRMIEYTMLGEYPHCT